MAAGDAVALLALAADRDGLLELAAVLARGRGSLAHRRDRAGIAAARVVPGYGLADRRGLRLVDRGPRVGAVGAVEAAADLAPHQRADEDARGGGGDLPRAAAELGAEQAAQRGAAERAYRLLRTVLVLRGAGRE